MIITYEVGSGLYINITNRCNNACVFCVRDEESGGGYGDLWLRDGEPSVEEIEADIDKRDISKYSELVFCGYGEPTMRLDDMLEVAGCIREKYPEQKIRLNTNGLANLQYKEDVTPRFEGLFDVVSISLNTAHAEHYNSICRPVFGADAYEGLLDFARKMTKHVPEVVLTVVDTTIPPEEIEECRDIAEEIGAVLRVRDFIE